MLEVGTLLTWKFNPSALKFYFLSVK